MLRKLALTIVAVALLAAVGWRFATRWAPDRTGFPTQGIDVSHYQGDIDWNAARAAGLDFAYIKASEGSDLRDDRFAANWSGTAAAGVKRGAYHFFSLCRPGREQATNFIALVPREPEALPHAIDLEFGGNCAKRPPRDALLREVATFIQMVEGPFGTAREYNGAVTSRHLGTDFSGAVGAPVLATNRGRVALVADFYLAGKVVYLDHGEGLNSAYFHLRQTVVKVGDYVQRGQCIGGVGQSGRVTGPHLHWVMRYGGVTVDPMSVLALLGAE